MSREPTTITRDASVVTEDEGGGPSLGVPRRGELAGFGWMAVASLLFAVMSIAARMASRTATWPTIAASRSFMGALVALGFALRTGASLKTRSPKLSLARSVFGTFSMLLTFYALGRSDLAVGDAVTLFATAPLFIAVIAPVVLKEKTEKSLFAILAVAFMGVACIAGPHLAARSWSAVAALAAALFSAFAMMFLRLMRSGRSSGAPESSEAIAFHFAALSFCVHFVICLFTFRVPAAADIAFLAVTGLAGGLAQLAMTRAYALADAARLGASSYLGTVISLVAATVLLGERPTLLQLGGAALVVGAGVVLALQAARAGSARRTAPRTADKARAAGTE